MSEHDEFMPLCADTEDNNKCVECGITLNRIRDGTTDSNHRCHNCYWREHNMKARQEKEIVPLICHRCKNTFDWEPEIGNICDDCTE
jgi:hypothetical protein